MSLSPLHGLLPVALCVVAASAAAQATAPTGRKPDPLDAHAAVPAATYESAFTRYRRLTADKAVPWRESNETVARIGGWRAYAREAQPPELTPATAPTKTDPTAVPTPQGRDGQKTP